MRVEQVGHAADHVVGLEAQVAVGQHAALGPTRGARRVDDGGDVVRGHRGTAGLELIVGDVGTGLAESVDRALVEHPDVLCRDLAGHLLVHLLVLLVLQEHPDAVGVAQDPLDLLGRRGLVDRDDGRAHEPAGVVRQRPLIAGGRHDGDALAVLDPGCDQTLGQRLDLGEELLGGDVLPVVADAPAQCHAVGVVRGLCEDVVGEPSFGDLFEQWCF